MNLEAMIAELSRPFGYLGSRRKNTAVVQILVGNVANLGLGAITLAVKIRDVAVDLRFGAVELRKQAALGVGDRADVEYDGLPFESRAPRQGLEANLDAGPRLDEQLHRRPAKILIAVDGMK